MLIGGSSLTPSDLAFKCSYLCTAELLVRVLPCLLSALLHRLVCRFPCSCQVTVFPLLGVSTFLTDKLYELEPVLLSSFLLLWRPI